MGAGRHPGRWARGARARPGTGGYGAAADTRAEPPEPTGRRPGPLRIGKRPTPRPLSATTENLATAAREASSPQYVLYGKNFPLMTMRTRSPLGSGSRVMSMLKSMADMMPSPNSSWISCLKVVP